MDVVTFFRNDEHLKYCLEAYGVDTMVVGEEYKDKHVVGAELVNEVIFFNKIDGHSTTKILNNDKMG